MSLVPSVPYYSSIFKHGEYQTFETNDFFKKGIKPANSGREGMPYSLQLTS